MEELFKAQVLGEQQRPHLKIINFIFNRNIVEEVPKIFAEKVDNEMLQHLQSKAKITLKRIIITHLRGLNLSHIATHLIAK